MRSGKQPWKNSVPKPYELLIFDWDGTLVDSISHIVTAVQRANVRCALPECSAEQIKGLIGLGLEEVFRALHQDSAEAWRFAEFKQQYLAAHHALDTEPSPLFAEVLANLERFTEQGYRLAVATGKSRAALDQQLKTRGLEHYFAITRCADETASKPDPLMLSQILAYCDLDASQALLVGDSSFDLKMAQRAGMDAVGVSYGAQSALQLSQYAPRLIIEHFSQLRHWLEAGAKASIGVNEYVE